MQQQLKVVPETLDVRCPRRRSSPWALFFFYPVALMMSSPSPHVAARGGAGCWVLEDNNTIARECCAGF